MSALLTLQPSELSDMLPSPEPACSTLTGELTSVFFSDKLSDIARAKRICATCPVMADCLEGALTRHEPWGVWGGQLLLAGRIVEAKRSRGRPPKHPRPEDRLPVIPVPEHLRGRYSSTSC